mgnify:CR=1 FL=1
MEKENKIEKSEKEKKVAVVTIIGRPSSGKSTFLNVATGENVSIVSAVPQTTRNAIRGIVNTSLGQLVFVDTPGYHDSEKKMNLRMRSVVSERLSESDLVLYVVDTTREIGEEERLILEFLWSYQKKTVVALNKIDCDNSKKDAVKAKIREVLLEIPEERFVFVSAKNDLGIDETLRALYSLAPTGEMLYGEEFYTDQEVDFRIAEVIRGEAINRLEKEIPHCIYVRIDDLEMRSERKVWCRASLCVESESQKGIVIGKGASMIKAIRVESIKRLRKIFDWKIDLDLQVRVDKNWRQKDRVLDKILR